MLNFYNRRRFKKSPENFSTPAKFRKPCEFSQKLRNFIGFVRAAKFRSMEKDKKKLIFADCSMITVKFILSFKKKKFIYIYIYIYIYINFLLKKKYIYFTVKFSQGCDFS